MNATNPSFVGPNVSAARDFTRHLADLLRKEHGAMVNFLLALAECDGRRLWAELGYASLFEYLHRELGLSKSAAFYRKTAVGLVQRYPEIADALADGRLCMSSVAEVAKVITPENVSEILPRFFHRSSREAKEVAAEIAPDTAPPRREVISIVPAASVPGRTSRSATSAAAGSVLAPELIACRQFDSGAGRIPAPEPTRATVQLPPRSEEVEPLTAELRRVHITVTKRWVEKLDAVKAALSHSIPSGSAAEVIDAAFDALLEREARRKGLVKNPRTPRDETEPGGASTPEPSVPTLSANGTAPSKPRRKAVPAHVRREVTVRDEAKCQAKLHDGTLCGSKVRLQFDHVHPTSLGGPTTIENGRVLCGAHNQLAAQAVFGELWMEQFGKRPK